MPRLLIGLAGIDMARRTGAPEIGMIDFPRGAFLQKELSLSIEDPKVNGSVREVIHMDVATESGLENPVLRVHHITDFSGVIVARMSE
jgi:hypothetical protein